MAEWLTVSEACQLSGYHADHLRELIREKKVYALKKGNAWWVDKESLAAYLEDAATSGDGRRGPKSN